MIDEIIYRIQDDDGRGPWKPGFSEKWTRQEPDFSLQPWFFTMGPIHLEANIDEFVGCGCLKKDQLKRWISENEYKRLLGFGYKAVELKARVLGEDKNQCVFASQEPLNKNVSVFELYPLMSTVSKVKKQSGFKKKKISPPPDGRERVKMKKYQIIYADPPWQYKRTGGSSASRNYSTMTVKQICEMPVVDIAADNSLLFLWTTNSFLREAFDVVTAWGFEYKTCITWKKDRWGLGYWAWGQTEHCFLCARGKHTRITPPLLPTIFEAKRTKHSKKPDAFRSVIEKFPYTPRVELFARQKTEGWDVWGNEVKSDITLIAGDNEK